MKHVKLFEDFLNEIGDGGAAKYKTLIKIKENEHEVHTFKTETQDYQVYFEFQEDWTREGESLEMLIEFSVNGGKDSHIVTNKGEMYRVMATIVDLSKKILKRRKNIHVISFTGSKNKGSNDKRRNNLYMAYMKKHLKPKNIEDDGNTIRIEL
jgi:hypothetical protein